MNNYLLYQVLRIGMFLDTFEGARLLLFERFSDLLEVSANTLFLGLVLGNSLDMSPQLRDQIKITGTLYFFVVSGLHVSIVEQMMKKMFSTVLPHRLAGWLILLSISTYSALIGMTIPIVRTLSTRFYAICGRSLGKIVSSRYFFVLSVLFCVLLGFFQSEPWVASISFQLSYGAILGIHFLFPNSQKHQLVFDNFSWIKKAKRVYVDSVLLSLSVNMILAPLLLYYFGSWNPTILVVSTFLSPLIALQVSVGCLFLLCEVLLYVFQLDSTFLSYLFVLFFSFSSRITQSALAFFSRLSLSINWQPELWHLYVYFALIFFSYLAWGYAKKSPFSTFL